MSQLALPRQGLRESLLKFLIENQNGDGGWGYYPGKQSALEPTAYGVMGLSGILDAADVSRRAIAYLKSKQTANGGWPANDAADEPAEWVSPVVGLALLTVEGFSPSCQRAGEFVLGSFGKIPLDWKMRIGRWFGRNSINNINMDLGGWSWTSGTALWVEPTSYALIFLKRLNPQWKKSRIDEVLSEANAMLYDRMCPEGGWNYGNTVVLGEELRPFPQTTALALIALQENASRQENQRSLLYLRRELASQQSALNLGFGCLCLDVYGWPWASQRENLDRLYSETRFHEDLRTSGVALMALAAESGNNVLKF